jgi:choline dehydrogenase-like flavoprotein
VVARHLAEAGLSVVCLEQGEWPDRSTFRGADDDWELALLKEWSSTSTLRNAPGDHPMDTSASEMPIVDFNGVGGGTVLFAAQWHRMMPADFQVASVDGVAADWPIGYADLQPYYDRVDRDFGVSALGGNPAYPPGADPPLPPLPIGDVGLRVARAHARLGWHWWPESQAILSAPYDGRRPCVRRGVCMSGCAEGAKASTDLTHWPRAIAAGARLVTGARASRLLTDDRGLVTGAEWVARDGTWHFQPADVTLCAANGIGTPRLLLSSATPACPDGLANSSGMVGRNLMRHPIAIATGSFEDVLGTWQGQNGGFICSTEFYGSDASRGFVRGAKWTLGPSGGPLTNALAAGVWGPDHHRVLRERLGRTVLWQILGEDLPELDNRVELSDTLTDEHGIAAPRVTYRVSDNAHRMLAWHLDRAQESLREAGAWKVDRYPGPGRSGHMMGTARMGDDPRSSVVDRWCMAHDVANLGVVDSSVFVTVGGVNPTSTLCAVALRAAEHLVARHRDLPRPRRTRSFAVPSVPSSPPPAAPPPRLPLDDGQRRRLRAIADMLVPAGDGMPGAGAVLDDARLDRAVRSLPDTVDLGAILAMPDEELVADEAAMQALRIVVAGAYYLDPGVRAALGYPGQEALVVRALDFPEYLTEGLLDVGSSNPSG